MTEEKISEGKWMVLEYFILNESKQLEKALQKNNHVTSKNIDHFSTYPGEIESNIDISRVTAGDACKHFLKMSLLEIPTTDYTHLKGAKSKFYSLKSDMPTIRKLVKLIMEQLPYSEAQKLLDNYYFTYNLNESLIREVLCEKDVNISRTFCAMDWSISDAQRIIDIFEKNEGSSNNQETSTHFVSTIKEIILRYEENNNKFESQYIEKLKNFCDEFYEDLKNNNFDAKEYYFRDYNIYNISKSKHYDFRIYKDVLVDFAFFSLISPFSLKLPVFSDEISEIKKIEKIKESNLDIFYEKYYGYSYEALKNFPNFLKQELNDIISRIEVLQKAILRNSNPNKNIIKSCTDSPLEKLLNTLRDYINQIEQKQNQCTTFLRFDDLEKNVTELYSLTIEHLECVREKNTDDYFVTKLNIIESSFEMLSEHLKKLKNIKELENQYIQNNYSNILQEHYSTFEYEKLILPILALIQSSPLALNEFLNGEWNSFDLYFFGDQQKAQNSVFLTKLIHIAFIDLMCRPIILEKSIVECISFNSYCPSFINYFEISGIESHKKCTECMDNYYNEISYDRLRNIDKTPLKIKLKHLYELTLYLSFTATSKGDNQKISSSLSLDINPDIECYLFRIGNLKDVKSLISKLKKTDNAIYNHIRGLLSNKMQNIVLHYDISSQPSLRLKQEILNELNLVVLKPELYCKDFLNELAKLDEKIMESIEEISTTSLSLKDLVQMVHAEPSYNLSTEILINNKRILQKIFQDEFEVII